MKNTSPHLVNNERPFLAKKIFWTMRYYVRQLNKNLLNVLRSKKADGLKISQIIIYVNSHFDVFLYHERHCTRTF